MQESPTAIPVFAPADAASVVLPGVQTDDFPSPELRTHPSSELRRPVQDQAPEHESGEFLASLPQHLDDTETAPRALTRKLAIAALVLIFLGAASALLLRRGRFAPPLLAGDDAVVLTEIENRTGNAALDDVLPEGLQMALSQSHHLLLTTRSAYRAARHLMSLESQLPANQISGHNVAQRLGAKAYFSGMISGSEPPYLLHVDLRKVASNDLMAGAEEHVQSLQDLPSAIDRVAETLRINAGEQRESLERSSNPLAREATTSLEALRAFSQGEEALGNGRILDALRSYQRAAALDSGFVQVHLRLSQLYQQERAELAAAEAAKLAVASSGASSDRIRALAQYEFQMNVAGDYVRASAIIKLVIAQNPHDSSAMEALARTLRLEGRFTEALQMAQQAYAEDPFNVEAYLQAESSLLGLDRYDAAAQLQGQIDRLGLGQPGGALIPGYLEGRQDIVDNAVRVLSTHKECHPIGLGLRPVPRQRRPTGCRNRAVA